MARTSQRKPTPKLPKPCLILGVGNILLGDEGVGVHVVRAIEARVEAGDLALPEGVEVSDGGTMGLDLMDLLEGRRKVVVIDALDPSGGAAPGAVLRFTAEDLARLRQGEAPLRRGEARRQAANLSLHQVGLFEAIEMARILGRAPQKVVIFGIVPKDMSPGLELSAEVAAVVPEVIRRVMAEIAEGK